MGLFKSDAEIAAQKDEKLQKALEKYNLQDLTDVRDMESVRTIMMEMISYKWYDAARLLGNDSATLDIIATTNKSIMEQNFIIIRQLDRIAKALEK